MSRAHPSVFAAIHKAKTTPTPAQRPDWTWRSTGCRGVYGLHRGNDQLGMVSLLDHAITHESVAMNQIVELLNTHHKGNQ